MILKIIKNNMRDRPNRNLNLEDCNCCIITCLPCISIWSCLEYALKGLCCCPCYIDVYCCEKKKKKVIPKQVVVVLPRPNDEENMTNINEIEIQN